MVATVSHRSGGSLNTWSIHHVRRPHDVYRSRTVIQPFCPRHCPDLSCDCFPPLPRSNRPGKHGVLPPVLPRERILWNR
ncbi:hypothetical protein A1O7_05326 [Cladophialophora yegresii CBS 114405]|uniref:Uncharacterized protein n=1 Tax=Cladophialophora yegresii CBS 114405 TaxID=1182544 RepID=W9VQT8_9EURO|nr:uncharacterized protein A1O7_05326 [Cladophialophora yegresii CBS 114405]EXJ57903.1 hypothetical protein A1O7_05326 [Cladophialophora yegresii CBS 114405]